ncbi:MAG TPA: YihY/virulence factor BrkB family protein [Blastocatellia bacterium]|nr:YihY/virulence factor BrkB family protein [Blastocatellia bacterium]
MMRYLKKMRRVRALRSRLSTFPQRKTWRQIAYKTWDRLFEDEVFGRSAQLAYYWLFSLFPLLILVTGLLAHSPLFSELDRWLNLMDSVLPPQAFALVKNTSYEIIRQRQHGLLSFSFLVVIWASSSGMGAVITSLNKAFNASQSRPWWKERFLAIILTLGLTFFIIVALMLIFFGDHISTLVARAYDYGAIFTVIWNTAQWLVVILFVLLGVELIYYFAPNIKQRWEFFTPGALFALVLWLLISFGFRFYVSHFANYNAFYGALGSVMVLMLWLYLTSVAILVGGVINSIIRKP